LTTVLLTLFETTTATGGLEKGISATMIALGIGIWLVVGLLFWFIIPPPMGFVARSDGPQIQSLPKQDMDWRQMLATVQFWLLFIMFFSGASAGLVFISVAADLGRNALGQWAFLAIVVLSVGNSGGRLLAGIISDRIGRHWTLLAGFACQGAVVALLLALTRQGRGPWPIILAEVLLIGLNYGSIQTLFPATCRDYFGIRNFGLNYGLLFTAFGTAGLIMPWLNGWIRDVTGKPDLSYLLIIGMMALSAILSMVSLRLGNPTTPSSKIALNRGE
jgi:MFS family permease